MKPLRIATTGRPNRPPRVCTSDTLTTPAFVRYACMPPMAWLIVTGEDDLITQPQSLRHRTSPSTRHSPRTERQRFAYGCFQSLLHLGIQIWVSTDDARAPMRFYDLQAQSAPCRLLFHPSGQERYRIQKRQSSSRPIRKRWRRLQRARLLLFRRHWRI